MERFDDSKTGDEILENHKLEVMRPIGLDDTIMEGLLRVPDNFNNMLDNIIDDDETLPEMEVYELESNYTGEGKFEDIDDTDIESNIIEAPSLDMGESIWEDL